MGSMPDHIIVDFYVFVNADCANPIQRDHPPRSVIGDYVSPSSCPCVPLSCVASDRLWGVVAARGKPGTSGAPVSIGGAVGGVGYTSGVGHVTVFVDGGAVGRFADEVGSDPARVAAPTRAGV